MAKLAIHKLLTEILYGIEKLICIRFMEHFAQFLPISNAFYVKLCGS